MLYASLFIHKDKYRAELWAEIDLVTFIPENIGKTNVTVSKVFIVNETEATVDQTVTH